MLPPREGYPSPQADRGGPPGTAAQCLVEYTRVTLVQTNALVLSLWHSHGAALGVIWLVSIVSFGGAACLVNNRTMYIDDTLYSYYVGLLWLSGLVLINTESTAHGLQFAFPVQRFTLPLSTWTVTSRVLLYRVGITILHTAICLFPLYIGDAFAPIFFGVTILAMGLQWAAFLQARRGALRSFGEVLMFLIGGLLAVWSVSGSFTVPSNRATLVLAILILPVLCGCVRAARIARWNSFDPLSFISQPLGIFTRAQRMGHTLLYQLPASPLWAQTWLEFRSTALWFPVSVLSITPLILAPIALTSTVQLEVSDLSAIESLGLAAAFATGYLWEYRNRPVSRFGLALPLSDFHRSSAHILAGICAVVVTYLGIVGILAAALAVRSLAGDPLMDTNDATNFIRSLAIASATVWCIALGSGRILILIATPALLALTIRMAVFWDVTNEIETIMILLMVLSATVVALGLLGRHHFGLPVPWALAAVPILILLLLQIEVDAASTSIQSSTPLVLLYLFPLATTLAVLDYARRASLLSLSAILRLGAACAMIFCLLLWLWPVRSYNMGLVERDSAAYVAAGLILPFVWYPMLARIQRAG